MALRSTSRPSRSRRRVGPGLLVALALALVAPWSDGALHAAAATGSQGRDAGAYRSLIGKSYDSNGRPAGLKGFSYVGGTGFDDDSQDEPELAVVHFRRGATDLVVFHSRPRSGTRAKILDVLTVASVPKGRVLVIGDCRYDGADRPSLIALARADDPALLTRIERAWYVDRDRLRISRTDTGLIDCYAPGS
jgi:hypothetical protein